MLSTEYIEIYLLMVFYLCSLDLNKALDIMKIIENKALTIFKDFFGKKEHLHSDVLSNPSSSQKYYFLYL